MRSALARIVMIVFMIISIGPIPITSTIGLLIVIFRPQWFKHLVCWRRLKIDHFKGAVPIEN
jgi:hypothetical protein